MRSKTFAAALSMTLTLIVATATGATPALAETHPPLPSFGSFTNPNGIAVDESTGDVYVADIGTNAVSKFDASGTPVNFNFPAGSHEAAGNALKGADTPAGSFSFPVALHGNPAAIAVDNACVLHTPALSGAACTQFDPSAGDLYVMDAGTGHNVIDKFSSSGAYLGQITGPFPGEVLGLGVDAGGNVRVDAIDAIDANAASGVAIEVFDNSTANAYVTLLVTSNTGGTEAFFNGGITAEHGFAAGPTGDDYMLYSCGCMEKVGPNMAQFGRVDSSSTDVAAAVDPATGHVYVDEQSSVAEWDPGEMNGRQLVPESEEEGTVGKLVSSFGFPQLSSSSGQGGIAVNGASGEVYVSNPADHKVYAFSTTVPAVAADATTNITQTTATLNGTIDPRRGSVTSCQFEYGVRAETASGALSGGSYNQTVQCDKTPAQIESGTGAVAVSADISGLRPGLLYQFRLNAPNANGASPSGGLFATPGPGFGIKPGGFEVSFLNEDGTPDTQAGSHPNEMTTNIAFNTRFLRREPTNDSPYSLQPDGNFKDVIVDVPPGLVGDPNATAKKCTLRQLDTANDQGGEQCPAESVVGELEVEFGDTPLGGFAGGTFKEPVYNMVPPHGVAVQFGAHFIEPSAFINIGVHAGGDYPVQAESLNAPVWIPVITTRLKVFGVVGGCAKVPQGGGKYTNSTCTTSGSGGEYEREPSGRKAFLTLPTGCNGPLRSSISVDSYQNPGQFVEAGTVTRDSAGQPIGLTGCSKLTFPPTITVSPDTTDASTSSGLTVGVHVSQKAALNPEGLAESSLRDTTVTLPEGVALNPAGADGLEACSEGLAGFTGFSEFNSQFEPGVKTATFTSKMPEPLQPSVNFCPNGSKIGTVKIKTPLLPNPLEGAVYLAAQNANPFGSLVAMYLIAEDPISGTLIKLTGEVRLSETGQIVTTFKNTPDLPFEDLELHFFGGERAPLTTPSRCGTYTTNASFTPWDGNGPVNTSSSFQITSGPNGSPCPGASLPFAPSLTAGTTNIQAGAFSPFTMTMSREDGNQNLQAISLKMPPGLSGLLTGVELCGEAQANAGTCGPNSLIGVTIVSVGVGNDPFTVTGGKVYLTGPYEGAPFGLSIVNPAKAGPYDLGQVIVRAKIEVDPITADLTVTSDNEGPYKIPQFIDGIPLQIKHVNVTVNRPGFTFNPTNCSPMSITGSLDSTEGASDALAVPFQATNCAALGFKPQFSVSTAGKTSRAKGASLDVKLAYPKAPFGSQANIKSVKVDLPKQLPSRLTTLQKACTAATFAANPAACPAGSRVGTATATTPLLPVPLSGPAYFVSHGGAKFPELIIVLSGYGVTVQLHGETFINKAGITSSTFRTIPDVPVGTFELKLPEASNSALAANADLCALTKTVLVKKKVTVKSRGHTRTVTRKVKKTVPGSLVMPTAFTAQNGTVIKQNTPIGVTGCGKAKKAKSSGRTHKSKRKKTKKK